jgi:hypothetical protein
MFYSETCVYILTSLWYGFIVNLELCHCLSNIERHLDTIFNLNWVVYSSGRVLATYMDKIQNDPIYSVL